MIEMNDVHFAYCKKKGLFRKREISRHVLQGISLQIHSGELYGLVGPNGSGKTTLIKLLLGIYEPDRGEIMNGENKRPTINDWRWREKVGFVSGASTKLFATIDLYEHIVLYKSLYRSFDADWLHNKLEEFNLHNRLHSMPTSISFGERIKFEIALTLAYRPEILVLDEPTVGLDPMVINTVRLTIREYLYSNKVCGILTSHNLKDITEICSRGSFLLNGVLTDHFECKQTDPNLLEDRYREVFGGV